jgi:hypothetical protein
MHTAIWFWFRLGDRIITVNDRARPVIWLLAAAGACLIAALLLAAMRRAP